MGGEIQCVMNDSVLFSVHPWCAGLEDLLDVLKKKANYQSVLILSSVRFLHKLVPCAFHSLLT